uniref:Uncharacterized protein n=1 Tax=viral metagenome TaxID=1070528 RepID=A0A6H2A0H5_9ZZZZ
MNDSPIGRLAGYRLRNAVGRHHETRDVEKVPTIPGATAVLVPDPPPSAALLYPDWGMGGPVYAAYFSEQVRHDWSISLRAS